MKMKRILYLCGICCVVLALLLAAYGVLDTQKQAQQETMPEKEENPKAQVEEPVGEFDVEHVLSDGVQEAMVDENTVLPSSIPVFHNRCPIGWGGPMYEITQADRDLMMQNLSRFLTILRSEAPNPDELRNNTSFSNTYAIYQDAGYQIHSSLDGIFIQVNRTQLPEELTAETIEANSLLQAAMEYLGIEDPEITRMDQYDKVGQFDSYEITIANHGEDLMRRVMNQTLSAICMNDYGSTDQIWVYVIHRDPPEEYRSFPIIPLADAVADARAAHRELPADGAVKADIFYSTAIEPDYFIPCYRLYFVGSETGIPQCVQTPMVDVLDLKYQKADAKRITQYVDFYSTQDYLVDENTVLPESVPVFHNSYPYGQDGPLFEITEAEWQQLKERLSDFMVLLPGEAPDPGKIAPNRGWPQDHVVYREEDFIIRSYVNELSINLPQEQIPEDITVETIQEVPLLKAAVDDLGIENPEISRFYEYDQDGTPIFCDILIANQGEDLMQRVFNRTGCYVSFSYFVDSELEGDPLLTIYHRDFSEEYRSFPTIPLADAVAAARADHSELPADGEVPADIYFSSSIEPHYLIPCYRLYFTETETGIPLCVSTPMIDVEEFERQKAER